MTQVVYNGPHPVVVVDEWSQNEEIVRGEPVDIPDDLAARLLEQDTWAQAKTPTPTSTSSPTVAADSSPAPISTGSTPASPDASTDSTKGNS